MTIKPQHQRFADAYLAHGNATQAYKDAGYKGKGDVAVTGASEILRNPHVANYIANIQHEASELAALSHSWVLLRLKENVHRSMQAIPVLDRKGVPTGEWQYEGAVANRSLELIGKHLGMFTDVKADDSAREVLEAFSKLFSKREAEDTPVIDVDPVSPTRALIEGNENAI